MTIVEYIEIAAVVPGEIFDGICKLAFITPLPTDGAQDSACRGHFDEAIIGRVGVPNIAVGEDENTLGRANVFVGTGDDACRVVVGVGSGRR